MAGFEDKQLNELQTFLLFLLGPLTDAFICSADCVILLLPEVYLGFPATSRKFLPNLENSAFLYLKFIWGIGKEKIYNLTKFTVLIIWFLSKITCLKNSYRLFSSTFSKIGAPPGNSVRNVATVYGNFKLRHWAIYPVTIASDATGYFCGL